MNELRCPDCGGGWIPGAFGPGWCKAECDLAAEVAEPAKVPLEELVGELDYFIGTEAAIWQACDRIPGIELQGIGTLSPGICINVSVRQEECEYHCREVFDYLDQCLRPAGVVFSYNFKDAVTGRLLGFFKTGEEGGS